MTSRRLILIRHAKTEQEGPADQGDHGRRLLPRGEADASAAGEWLVARGLVPDLVLCSSSVRTRQTWEQMATGAEALSDVEFEHDRRIYNASSEELLTVLVEAPEENETVAMIGHAPGIPDLVADLVDADGSSGEALEALDEGFSTMACAVLEVDGDWADLRASGARLTTVETPRGAQP